MSKTYDAIIIGAGVIGSAIGFELAKKGYKTINIDRNPTSGYGSTAASCAIIRVHYSTFDGCALAYEGYHYWNDWENYLGVLDEKGLAKFIECGCMIYKTEANQYLQKIIKRADELNIPYHEWTAEEIKENLPIVDTHKFGPVKMPTDAGFGKHNNDSLKGSVFFPTAGYINDPNYLLITCKEPQKTKVQVFNLIVQLLKFCRKMEEFQEFNWKMEVKLTLG